MFLTECEADHLRCQIAFDMRNEKHRFVRGLESKYVPLYNRFRVARSKPPWCVGARPAVSMYERLIYLLQPLQFWTQTDTAGG
jgi:hypothetical protein